MSFRQTEPYIELNNQTKKVQYSYFDLLKKPIEIYLFIDPICQDSWIINPYIKKLQLEYGRYFTIRPILSSKLLQVNQRIVDHPERPQQLTKKINQHLEKHIKQTLNLKHPIKYPADIFFAIKAAELQGIKAGRRYLNKIQENLFLKQADISIDEGLIRIASEVKLDVEEFKRDLHSNSAKKALQCDLKVSREMEVDQTPSIVFFSESEEDEGLKISGSYGYDIYVKVLTTLLQKKLIPFHKPDLESFMQSYQFTTTDEIAIIYDWTYKKAERELKKLLLKRVVSPITVSNQTYWRYYTKD